MAVVRCPNCSKPNPDFLEVCQYCEAPLHGGPAPQGAPRAADETLVPPSRKASAPEVPPGTPGTQESSLAAAGPQASSPASSGPAPSGADDEAAASESPATQPETEAEPLGWLDKLRAKHAGEGEPAARTGPAVEPDWMWTGQPGDEPATPAAQTDAGRGDQDPTARLPVWLRGLDLEDEPPAPPIAPTTQVGTRPFAGPKTDEPLSAPSAASTPSRASLTGTATSDDVISPRPRKKMTDRLKGLGSSPQAVPEPPPPASTPPSAPALRNTDADLPDWLKAITNAAPPAARSGEPAKPVEPPPAAHEEQALPRSEVPWPRLAEPAAAEQPAAPSPAEEALPLRPRRKMTDWLNALQSVPPAAPSAGPEQPAPANADADLPPWLRAISATPAAGARPAGGTTSASPAAGGTTSASPAAGSKPLIAPTAGSPAGAPATPSTPAGPAPQLTTPSETGGLQTTAQPGAALQPTAPPAAAPTPEDELPAWLKALRAQSALPARPVPGTTAPQSTTEAAGTLALGQRVQELPAGLRPKSETPGEPSRLSGVIQQAGATMPPSAAPAPEPLPDDMPQWLRGILSAQAQPAAPAAPAAPGTPAAPPGRASLNELLRPTSPLSSRAAPAPLARPKLAATESASGGPAPSAAASGTPAADDTLAPAPRRPRRMTDWLGSAPVPPATPNPAEDDLPEWLRKLSLPQAAPPPSAPAAKIDLPDWFDTIAPASTAPVTTAGAVPPASGTASEPAGAGTGALPAAADDMPDWIKMIAPSAATPATPAATPLPAAGTGPLPAAPVEDLPDWLKSIAPSAATPSAPAVPPPAAGTGPLPAASAEDLPDWLKSIAPSAATPATPAVPPPDAGTGPLPAASAEDLPDWVKALAPSVEAPAAPPTLAASAPPAAGTGPLPAASAEDLPDWLKSIAPSAVTPAATPPVTGAGPLPAAPAEDLPDWVKAIAPSAEVPAAPPTPAASAQTAAGTGPLPAAPSEDLPDWMKSFAPSAETPTAPAATASPDLSGAVSLHAERSALPPEPRDELPDWLKAIVKESSTAAAGAAAPAESTPAEPWPVEARSAPAWAASDAQAAPGDTAPAAEHDQDVSDWLNSLPASPDSTTTQAGADQLPAWMQSPSAGEQPQIDAETLAWLSSTQAAGAEAATPAGEHAAGVDAAGTTSVAPVGVPAWMNELAAASSTTATTPAPGAPAAPITTDAAAAGALPAAVAPQADIAPTPGEDLPDWLRSMRGEAALDETAPDEMPDWLRALRGLPPRAKAPGTDPSAADTTMVAGPDTPPAAPAPANLEQAALPAWLAAMRPVDIQRPEASEADSYQETLGVLAGMRGVLRAEPAVAQPHKATTPVQRLEVSDTHTAHANLLLELLHDAGTLLPARRDRVRLSAMVERWVVFAILVTAIVLAQFRYASLFPLPVPGATDIQPAFTIVNGLAPSKPALVAFDYEAAQQGELNPGAMALVSHLLRRGVPVVAVSTRLTGAAAGQALLDQSPGLGTGSPGAAAGYGRQYVNLGYIPGGPVGLLQFAAAPRSLFTNDFTGMFTTTSVWDSAPLINVSKLGDFGLIVLVSGTPESTRMWIEQAQSFAPAVPMLAVVSASAEPLVRPYLNSAGAPQGAALRGLVVGVAGAAQYEQLAGTPGAGVALWPALGGGLLAAAVLIAAGNLVFVLLGLLRERGGRSFERPSERTSERPNGGGQQKPKA